MADPAWVQRLMIGWRTQANKYVAKEPQTPAVKSMLTSKIGCQSLTFDACRVLLGTEDDSLPEITVPSSSSEWTVLFTVDETEGKLSIAHDRVINWRRFDVKYTAFFPDGVTIIEEFKRSFGDIECSIIHGSDEFAAKKVVYITKNFFASCKDARSFFDGVQWKALVDSFERHVVGKLLNLP